MMDKRNNKGFTLAELLIVVAIIAVLVAIAIPIINNQMEKSQEAHDIDTMRQVASLAVEYYYNGVCDKSSAEANGLKWWDNKKPDENNAAGVYDLETGKFQPLRSTEYKKEPYGKGTATDTGKKYYFDNNDTKNKNREMYKSSADYTEAVVMIAIYPEGNNKHIDIYWKNVKDGKYIGLAHGNNDPNYSIRISLE